jgi:hypothetical protein
METHEMVGKKVRSAIEEIGGTLPENIPSAEPIKKVEKRLKTSKPLLTLDPKDATGLVSPEMIQSVTLRAPASRSSLTRRRNDRCLAQHNLQRALIASLCCDLESRFPFIARLIEIYPFISKYL